LAGVGALGLEAELIEEAEVVGHGGVGGGEEFVAVEDGVGTGEEAEGLGFVGELGAAGGEADAGLGDGDAGDGDHAGHIEGGDGVLAGEGGAGHGHEGVDGDAFGGWVELGDDLDHFEAVLGVFAEAEDAAAADRHTGVLDVADGAEAVVEGVGGDDVGVIFGGGVDVVVVGGDAGFLEGLGFGGAEFAEGDADLHAEGGDIADDVEDVVEAFGAGADATPGGTHAETGGAGVLGGVGAFHDLAFFHEAFGIDAAVVAGRLGAVGAVLGAATGLDGEEGAELHGVLGPMGLVHGAGLLEEVEEGLVVEAMKFVVEHDGKRRGD